MRQKGRAVLLTLIVLTFAVGLDQGSKAVARRFLPGTGAHHVVGRVVQLIYAENVGAFLSLGHDWPTAVRQLVFIFLSALVLVATFGYILLSRKLSTGTTVGLACIVGGGLGNMVDRITRGGRVTDFLFFSVGPIHTGILNVADIFITTGVVILLCSYLLLRRSDSSTRSSSDPSPDR